MAEHKSQPPERDPDTLQARDVHQAPALHLEEQLGEREEPDHHGDDVRAAGQLEGPVGETVGIG